VRHQQQQPLSPEHGKLLKRRKLTSKGRQIREKPVTALTLCSQPFEPESSQRTSAATRSNSWSIKHVSLRKVNGHTPNERQQIETRIRAHGHWA
jgi:hypothetical protein